MYDYLIATDEGFRQSVKESEVKDVKGEGKEGEVKEDEELMKDEEEKKDEEEDESLLGDDESEEKENEEEDDEDALFAVSDEDMEDEPVLEVRSHSTPDP